MKSLPTKGTKVKFIGVLPNCKAKGAPWFKDIITNASSLKKEGTYTIKTCVKMVQIDKQKNVWYPVTLEETGDNKYYPLSWFTY